jgi:tetratricopeptide (TPR) repeat protein
MAAADIKKEHPKTATATVVEQLYAGSTIGEIIGFDEKSSDALYTMGYSYFMQGNFSEALKYFQYQLFFNHFDKRAAIGAGSCLFELGRYEESLKPFGVALLLDENNDPNIPLQIAKSLLMFGKKSEAKIILETMKVDYSRSSEFANINNSIEKILFFCNNTAGVFEK